MAATPIEVTMKTGKMIIYGRVLRFVGLVILAAIAFSLWGSYNKQPADICERFHMHKVFTNNGKNWRCVK